MYYTDPNCILFPLKNPDIDKNGLFRLINKLNLADRFFHFQSHVDQLFKTDCTEKKLIIISDISISGTQTRKALQYYTNQFQTNEEINEFRLNDKTPKEERYYTFSDLSESRQFRNNLENIKDIVILSPIVTKQFEEKITSILSINKPTIICKKPFLEQSEYLFDKLPIDIHLKELFVELIKDKDLINKLFKVKPSDYKNHLKDLNNRNILFRIGSLPKKHLLLLSLESKKGLKLLDFVEEWPKSETISNKNEQITDKELDPMSENLKRSSFFEKVLKWFFTFFSKLYNQF